MLRITREAFKILLQFGPNMTFFTFSDIYSEEVKSTKYHGPVSKAAKKVKFR